MKKILSGLFAALLCCCVFMIPQEVSAADLREGLYFYTVSNGEATITDIAYAALEGDVIVPDELGGYPVTAIGPNAFSGCNGLISIVIPDTVTSIDHSAFAFCVRIICVIELT